MHFVPPLGRAAPRLEEVRNITRITIVPQITFGSRFDLLRQEWFDRTGGDITNDLCDRTNNAGQTCLAYAASKGSRAAKGNCCGSMGLSDAISTPLTVWRAGITAPWTTC